MTGRRTTRRVSRGLELLDDRINPNSTLWVGGATGDWDDPANWSLGTIPDQTSDVLLPGGQTVTADEATIDIATLAIGPGSVLTSTYLTLTAHSVTLTGGAIRAGTLAINVPVTTLDVDSSIVCGYLALETTKNGTYDITTLINYGRIGVHTIEGVPSVADPSDLPPASNYPAGLMTLEGVVNAYGGLNLKQSSMAIQQGAGSAIGSLLGFGRVDGDLTNNSYMTLTDVFYGTGPGSSTLGTGYPAASSLLSVGGNYTQGEFGSLVVTAEALVARGSRDPSVSHLPLIQVNGQAISLGGSLDIDSSTQLSTLPTDWGISGYRSPLFGFMNTVAGTLLDRRFDSLGGLVAPFGEDRVMFAVYYNQPSQTIQVLTVAAPLLITAAAPGGTPLTNGGQSQLPGGGERQMLLTANASASTIDALALPIAQGLRTAPAVLPSSWDVVVVNWQAFSTGLPDDPLTPSWQPWTAARQAADIGESLVDWLYEVRTGSDDPMVSKYDQFHLISHSAGVWLENGFADRIEHQKTYSAELLTREVGLGHLSGPDQKDAAAAVAAFLRVSTRLTLFDAFVPDPGVETNLRTLFGDNPFIRWGEDPLPPSSQSIDGKLVLGKNATVVEHLFDGRRMLLEPDVYDAANYFVGPPLVSAAPTLYGSFGIPYSGYGIVDEPPLTATVLPFAYNVDVTRTDPDFVGHVVRLPESIESVLTTKNDPLSHAHGWPVQFYLKAIRSLTTGTLAEVTRITQLQVGPWTAASPTPHPRTGLLVLTAADVPWSVPPIADIFLTHFGVGAPPPATRALTVGVPLTAAGTSTGAVTFINPDQTVRFTVRPFGTTPVEVRTAAGDFNGDGVPDLVAGTGPGVASRVVVLDGTTQAVLFDVAPFEATFLGGIYVAAGDLNGDGLADLVVTPDEGGGPRVVVYSGAGFALLANFFGIDDPNFRGGARTAIGDINGDGVGDLIVAAGFGGGPRVAMFDGRTVGGSPARLAGDFFAFEESLRNGVYITAGDLDWDGRAEVIAGGGPGGGPRVTAFSGAEMLAGRPTPVANFFGGDPDNRGGIRLVAKDLDGDALADLVIGSGPGGGSRVTAYRGSTILRDGTPPELFAFDAQPGFVGGVFVG